MTLRRLFAASFLSLVPFFPGFSASAGEANAAYGALGYSSWTLGSWHPTAWSFRGGYYFAPWLAGEMQFLSRGGEDSGRLVDSGMGAYLRAELPLSRSFHVSVLAGYAYTDVIFPPGAKGTYDHSAYGLGVEWRLGRHSTLATDYISYNGDSRASSLTAVLKFPF